MDNRQKHRHSRSHDLPRSSRVNDRIMEYCSKFGRDRDLEKFMRLCSPSSSCTHHSGHSCTTTTSTGSTASSMEGYGTDMRCLFRLQDSASTTTTRTTTSSVNEQPAVAGKERIIPIRMEGEEDQDVAETENTPEKTHATATKPMRTPDSIAKTHKRLEWDSLADVGYKKSMSTSNISILERSLLREFFQETEKLPKSSNASEGDLEQLQAELLQERTLGAAPTPKTLALKHSSTPPLASSTMVAEATSIGPTKSSSNGNSNAEGTHQKTQSTSTSTSLLSRRHSEKYAQTTASRRASCISQEVQVSMSSVAATPSLIGSTATPTSFEVYSSRSSRSTTTAASRSNDDAADFQISRRNRRSQPHASSYSHSHSEPPNQPPPSHPFVAGITEMLAARRHARADAVHDADSSALATASLQQLHDTLKSALEENKENATSTSSSSFGRSPQLDLGIQLLCSLIEAKSLNAKQKKKLVRDIVRRISHLSDGGAADVGIGKDATIATPNFATSLASLGSRRSTSSGLKADAKVAYEHSKNSLPARPNSSSTKTADRIKNATDALLNLEPPPESSPEATDDQLLRIEVFKKPSLPTTSANAFAKLSAESKVPKYRKSQFHDANDPSKPNTTNQQPPLPPPRKNQNNVPNVTTSKNERDKIDKASQIEMPHENAITTANTILATATTNKRTTATTMAPTDKSSSRSAHSTTASTSTSKDLTTQKAANEPHHSSANTIDDAEQEASMREWLNPLTQSEIEYEEKKRELAKNVTNKRDKIVPKSETSTKSDTERDVQLNWIDSEIVRLESLRHLLLKDDDDTSTTEGVAVVAAAIFLTSPIKGQRRRQQQQQQPPTEHQIKTAEKLYDTVASEQNSSSLLSESAERLVQQIEVIIEESNEDVVNLEDNLKRTKERKRETHIIYDKPSAVAEQGGLAQGQPRFRTVRETIVRSEEQVLPSNGDVKAQRSKIDTPSSSYGGSNDTESVGSFVQQRKREFLEHYKQKKKNHYEALQQQEQQLRRDQQRQQRSASTGAMMPQQTTSSHYSVPQTMQRTYHQQLYNNYNNQMAAPTHPPPLPPHQPHSQHFTATTAVQTTSSGGGAQQNSSSSGITQTSSSSMFCISSEVSIPMGGSNASRSTTTTTTHQYDDVAAAMAGAFCYSGVTAVGVQTGDSVLRMQPFFGPRPYDAFACWQRPAPPQCVRTGGTTTACVQVKPKAIAYVIQFDGKTSSSENSSGTTNAAATNSEEVTPPSGDQEPPQLTLQDYLERARPKFLAQVKQRKAILNQIQAVRQEREREMRDIVAADGSNVSLGSLDRKLQRLPPPATKQIRIFATKQMKAMTNKHCATLPEVLAKQERDREQQRRRGNRIIRDVFNRRLQKRVRNGQLDLNHSKTVI